MRRSSLSPRTTLPLAVVVAAVFAVILVAGGALGRGADPVTTPSPTPSVAPSVQPDPTSPPAPTPKPTDDASGGPTTVALEDLTGHDVSVLIDDQTGTLDGATSGTPGDGMSVRWFDAKVENIDAETLRVVWVGLPRDEQLLLAITGEAGNYRLRIVQSAPPAYSDAVGFDRVLELRFDTPVSAGDVEVTIEEVAGNG